MQYFKPRYVYNWQYFQAISLKIDYFIPNS